MCVDIRKICECGKENVQFHMRDNALVPKVISRLFCPKCPGDSAFDKNTMISDNGWVIEYDMQLAQMMVSQRDSMDRDDITPEYIFDQGYACWQEMYPGEREDIKKERSEIIGLLKIDQKSYLEAIQRWNINRVEKLKSVGWRRVVQA